MLPVRAEMMSKMCSGSRRSFFFRMKCKVQFSVKEEADTTTGSKYTQSGILYLFLNHVNDLSSDFVCNNYMNISFKNKYFCEYFLLLICTSKTYIN